MSKRFNWSHGTISTTRRELQPVEAGAHRGRWMIVVLVHPKSGFEMPKKVKKGRVRFLDAWQMFG